MRSNTLNKIAIYSLLIFSAFALSGGAVIAAFRDSLPSIGIKVLYTIIPLALIMIVAGWLNHAILIPRLFIKGKYFQYFSCAFIAALGVPLSGIFIEAGFRSVMHIPDRIHNYMSPWIILDSLSTTALLMVIMVGMGVARVYKLWKWETHSEEMETARYTEASKNLQNCVHSDEILNSLDDIKCIAKVNPEIANSKLRKLSDTLRHDLYSKCSVSVAVQNTNATDFSWLSEFISSKRFTLLRDICLKILIASVSITSIFEAPDNPDFTMSGLWSFLGMFIVISILTYGNKSLCKHFLNKGKIKRYLASVFIFLLIITAVAISAEILSYVNTTYTDSISPVYSIIAILGTFCTITLYLGGITAIILLHNWLRTVRRVAKLKAETAKAELNFLQSQINPHFLFNVLNNVGILIYENPDVASDMLTKLRDMFEYQHEITKMKSISIKKEVEFIRNYLLLEQSRKTPYLFNISLQSECDKIDIPTLLLIPFVENASKHSTGTRDIEISISKNENRLIFRCENSYSARSKKSNVGGLGIGNTRRRLDLIYGDNYNLNCEKIENKYIVTLNIPYEMLDS